MKATISIQSRPIVVGMGLLALDITVGAEETVEDRLRLWTGGTTGNVLAALQFLGWQARPIARLTDDVPGRLILADLSAIGVDTSLVELEAGARTPTILHRIRTRSDGEKGHGYGWACPACGDRYGSFRPVLSSRAAELTAKLQRTAVFFFDRVSRSSLDFAKAASAAGAAVVFEPSASTERDAFEEVLPLVDVLKYADDRRDKIEDGLKTMARKPKPFLEVETRGAKGLRFRTATNRSWTSMAALEVPELKDAAGAGDWLTAGLIRRLARNGRKGLRQSSASAIEGALLFGQALSAWNCAFEGARGGMYQQIAAPIAPKVTEILSEQGFERLVAKLPKVRRKAVSDVCSNCTATVVPMLQRQHA